MTKEQRDELKRLAEAASDGPWYSGEGYEQGDPGFYIASKPTGLIIVSEDTLRQNDSAFIAAANPQAVMELLATIERLDGELQNAVRTIMHACSP
jgi:hypothetical protein